MMILHKDPGHKILHFSVCVVDEYLHFRRVSFTPNEKYKNKILRNLANLREIIYVDLET